jgi:UDP-glucose 4-epimerase
VGSVAGRRVLITGASGFIGQYVAEEALRRGYRVTGIDKKRSRTRGIEFIEANILDRAHMLRIVKDQDCVVHLAAVTSNVEFTRNPTDCYDVNANGFLNIIAAAARGACQQFVYASSAAVYLDTFSEDAAIDFNKQDNHYAKTKLMNEMVAKSYACIYGMRTTGLRFFNVYGNGENEKGDYASIVTIFLKARKNREPLVVYGDGRQSRDLIHVTDAARMTLDLVEKSAGGVYNVGTGVSTAYTAIAEMIDRQNIKYIPNPLANYQLYTKADTTRLRGALGGGYEVKELAEGIRAMRV